MADKSRKYKLLVSFLFVAVVVVIVVVVHAYAHSSCMTPHMEVGICVQQSACGRISQLLNNSSVPPPLDVTQYVQTLQCGVFNDIIFVCCAQNRNQAELTRTTSKTTTTTERAFSSALKIRPSVAKSEADIQSGMAILQASECAKSDVNDTNFSKYEYPWMALLVFERTGDITPQYCSGSLITDRYVLTVAHCILALDAILVSVRLGTDCTFSDRAKRCAPSVQEIDVEEVIYHKDYNIRQLINDIALVRLTSKAIFNTHVQPICLPITPQSQATTLDRATVAGWTTDDMLVGMKANVLKKAVVQVVANTYCQQIFRIIRITDKHMCAISTRNVFESGVSGGPLYISARYRRHARYFQYGILSAGDNIGSPQNLYTRVITYLPWIAGNLRL